MPSIGGVGRTTLLGGFVLLGRGIVFGLDGEVHELDGEAVGQVDNAHVRPVSVSPHPTAGSSRWRAVGHRAGDELDGVARNYGARCRVIACDDIVHDSHGRGRHSKRIKGFGALLDARHHRTVDTRGTEHYLGLDRYSWQQE